MLWIYIGPQKKQFLEAKCEMNKQLQTECKIKNLFNSKSPPSNGMVALWQLTWTVKLHCLLALDSAVGGGPRVVVSTAAFHARVRGSVPGLGGLKETKMFLPHPRVKVSIVGSLRDREVACSASDRQGSNFESCVWRTVSSQSSHHPQEVLLAQFSLYVHKGGLKPDSFHFIWIAQYSFTSWHCVWHIFKSNYHHPRVQF